MKETEERKNYQGGEVRKMKSYKGITLIALVVTIVVLLILAGISIAMLTGEDGIITQAQNAKENTRGGEVKETVEMTYNSNKTTDYTGIGTKKTREQVIVELKEAGKLTTEEYNQLMGIEGETKRDKITIGEIEIDFSILDGTPTGGGSGDDEQIAVDSLGIIPEINKDEMTPVKYNDTTKEWEEVKPEDLSKPGEWFDYNSQKWANVETENGYFVYIPRYAYKITSGYHKSLTNAGTMAIVFLNEDNTLKSTTDSEGNAVNESDLIHASDVNSAERGVGLNATTKYIIHPAFEAFDTADKKVDGLWVAKYEMSREDKQEDGTWKQNTATGDVETSADIRMVSKPGVSSWRNIQVTNIFENCYKMNRELESHMMKNTEWGAVAYLTVSKYGKGATSEVERNASSSYLTGYGADLTLSAGEASTTGNMYGIFDMSGGASEYVAGYLDDECMIKTESTTGENYNYNENLIKAESKYKDVYQIKINEDGTTSNRYTDCYQANNLKVGDALWEVTSNTGSHYGWYGEIFRFVGLYDSNHYPVFLHGGGFVNRDTDTGVFVASRDDGAGNDFYGFRVVCVVE